MKKLLSLLVIIVILNSCALFQSETFMGNWNLQLAGDYKGELHFSVDKDNNFSGGSMVEVQGYQYDIYYTGSISPEGDLVGTIEANNREVGELRGKIDYEKGNGNWSATGMKGTWTALKEAD